MAEKLRNPGITSERKATETFENKFSVQTEHELQKIHFLYLS